MTRVWSDNKKPAGCHGGPVAVMDATILIQYKIAKVAERGGGLTKRNAAIKQTKPVLKKVG